MMIKADIDRLLFGRDRKGHLPSREKVLERALVQIRGKADLAGDVLGPDSPGGRSWGLISSICSHALTASETMGAER